MARIMAFDYGEKRIGIAVSDPMRIIATGLETVDTPKIFDFIKSYIAKEAVDLFVVGYPRDLMNRDTHATQFTDDFISSLNKMFANIEVKKVDERFTSKIASQTIFQSGMGKEKRKDKSLVDKISAVLILQSYLEMNQR